MERQPATQLSSAGGARERLRMPESFLAASPSGPSRPHGAWLKRRVMKHESQQQKRRLYLARHRPPPCSSHLSKHPVAHLSHRLSVRARTLSSRFTLHASLHTPQSTARPTDSLSHSPHRAPTSATTAVGSRSTRSICPLSPLPATAGPRSVHFFPLLLPHI